MLLENVLKTTKYVAENSDEVKINQEGLKRIVGAIKKEEMPPCWEEEYHHFGSPEETAQYFFVLDTLNFCFFPDKGQEKWGINLKKARWAGYFALALCLKRAVGRYPLLDAGFLADIPLSTLKDILRGDYGEIPLMEKRWKNLKETGRVLLERFSGQTAELIKKAEGRVDKLTEIIFKRFPSFRDTAPYKGKEIYFLKRIQLFLGDIYGVFNGKGLGAFDDIHKLTCFADYKIPQILNNLGVLEYSPRLTKKIKKEELISAFSVGEVEIRANTVQAVEQIKQILARQGVKMTSFEIDWILWTMSKREKLKIPHHRTRTIYY